MRAFLTRRVALPVWSLILGAVVLIALASASGQEAAEDQAVTTTTSAAGINARAAATTTTARATTTTVATTTTTTAPPTTTTTRPKQWVEAARLAGSSNKRGDNFALTGGDARLRYTSQAGFFAVYVVDADDSLERSGGFPEVTCTEPCGDQTRLAKGAGEYYIEARGTGGSWAVVIEEFR